MRRVLAALGLIPIVISGCGGDATDVEEYSDAQIRTDLIEVMNSTHAFDLDFGDTSGPWPCPAGGDVNHLRAYHYESSPDALVLDGYLTYEKCEETSSKGHRFSVSGGITTSLSYLMDTFGRITSVEGASAGEVSWRAGGQSGSCVLDLSVVPADGSVHVSGVACGGAVDRTLP